MLFASLPTQPVCCVSGESVSETPFAGGVGKTMAPNVGVGVSTTVGVETGKGDRVVEGTDDRKTVEVNGANGVAFSLDIAQDTRIDDNAMRTIQASTSA